jgi:hypothetical protein
VLTACPAALPRFSPAHRATASPSTAIAGVHAPPGAVPSGKASPRTSWRPARGNWLCSSLTIALNDRGLFGLPQAQGGLGQGGLGQGGLGQGGLGQGG